ncbi:MAG: Smr/MutS family protein [Ardenticatenaceae bacterium]|nr:Smr/MutS family protein [Ardenticatenaceae bacterium]
MELDLHGLTVEEMRPRLDKYLDDAYLASLPRMRIIQGKETRRARCAAWSARSCSATRW